jgi:ribosome-associated toxin RatA of RatAB toxin-antitoxin module
VRTSVLVVVLSLCSASASGENASECGRARQACTVNDDVRLAGVRGVELDLVLAIPQGALWDLVSDCGKWPRYFPFVSRCLETTSSVYGPVLQIAGSDQRVVCRVRRQAPTLLEVDRVGGDLRVLHGRWQLERIDSAHTRVRYAVAAKALFVPGRIVRRALRELVPEVVAGLQRWADERLASSK